MLFVRVETSKKNPLLKQMLVQDFIYIYRYIMLINEKNRFNLIKVTQMRHIQASDEQILKIELLGIKDKGEISVEIK